MSKPSLTPPTVAVRLQEQLEGSRENVRSLFSSVVTFTPDVLAHKLGHKPTDEEFLNEWAKAFIELGKAIRSAGLLPRVVERKEQRGQSYEEKMTRILLWNSCMMGGKEEEQRFLVSGPWFKLPLDDVRLSLLRDARYILGDDDFPADNKTDKTKKNKKEIPDNRDVLRLAKKIKRDRIKGFSQIDSAREYCEEDEKKAKSLLRQLRRYRHLLD